MKPERRAGPGSPSKQRKAALRSFTFGVVFVILSIPSFRVSAADLASAPPPLAQPHYGIAPSVPTAPPQVIIVPGSTVSPQYNGAPILPPPNGASPYGVAPPVAPRVDVVPRPACPPIWRCGERGCGWQPGCAAPPERYSEQYWSPGPQVYSSPNNASPAPGYPGPYGSAGRQVFSRPLPAPDYPAPYGSPGSHVYFGPDNASPPPGYPGPYGSTGPQVYAAPNASPGPGYPGPYGSPGSHVYSSPDNTSQAPERYPGPYSSQAYPGRTGAYPDE